MRKERKDMDLTELRGQIDEIDSSIVDLYLARDERAICEWQTGI